MNRIWKYKLDTTDLQTIIAHRPAKCLTVQTQGEEVYLWALVDDSEVTKNIYIEMIGTGSPIPNNLRVYLGTVQLLNEKLVLHVFERLT